MPPGQGVKLGFDGSLCVCEDREASSPVQTSFLSVHRSTSLPRIDVLDGCRKWLSECVFSSSRLTAPCLVLNGSSGSPTGSELAYSLREAETLVDRRGTLYAGHSCLLRATRYLTHIVMIA